MTIEEAIKNYKLTPAWQVTIGELKCQCYWIDGLEHDYGKLNHEDPRLWIDYGGELVPYQQSIKRICWKFNIQQTNYSKYNWNHTSFNSGISVEMIANDKVIFEFRCHDMNYAFARIQVLIFELGEHPYNFFDPESENGRKIWYKGLPATIKSGWLPGCINIIPDLSNMPFAEWKRKYLEEQLKTEIPGSHDYEIVKADVDDMFRHDEKCYFHHGSALSDDAIDWFRK